MRQSLTIFVFLILGLALNTRAQQRITRGIVVDSISMASMPGVSVVIKNGRRGTLTDAKGMFALQTNRTDTLLISYIGYNTIEVPLLFEEDELMIRLGERIKMLKEITITGERIMANEVTRTQHVAPRKMSTADAFASPWEYFTHGQKDRRKTIKLINENNRVRTYVSVVNDPLVREQIMEQLDISETQFYNTLALFNQRYRGTLLYSTDESEIITAMKVFFRQATR